MKSRLTFSVVSLAAWVAANGLMANACGTAGKKASPTGGGGAAGMATGGGAAGMAAGGGAAGMAAGGGAASAGRGGGAGSGAEAGGGAGGGFSYSCGAFATGSGWTTAPGFRAAVVAVGAPLSEPVALTFPGANFGVGVAMVVDQKSNVLFRLDTRSGAVTPFVAGTQWPTAPRLLTTILADTGNSADGALYVGDQGADADGDSKIFHVSPNGTVTTFAEAPGAGLDDIYGMAFSPGGDYPPGLYVSGDTDGTGVGFGRLQEGKKNDFAAYSGIEGLAVDVLARFGGGLFATAPAGGGYAGDDTLSRIAPTGEKVLPPLLANEPGIHAITFAPLGPFGGDAYVASWSSGKVRRVKPDGSVSDLASGLSLTNYDGNILAFSPDGQVLFVADRLASRIVCIEAAPAL